MPANQCLPRERGPAPTTLRVSNPNWAFDFAFLVAEFRTTTPESVKSSSIVVCRGLCRPHSIISKTYSATFSLDKNPLNNFFYSESKGDM